MPLLKLREGAALAAWVKREQQEACQHYWSAGTVMALRYDRARDDYTTGPTYRRICLRCDLVLDRAVPSPELKDLVRLNAPSQRWMQQNGFSGWQVEEHETADEEAVQGRYQQDQAVRATVRAERRG
jgi:hypothetical protein